MIDGSRPTALALALVCLSIACRGGATHAPGAPAPGSGGTGASTGGPGGTGGGSGGGPPATGGSGGAGAGGSGGGMASRDASADRSVPPAVDGAVGSVGT